MSIDNDRPTTGTRPPIPMVATWVIMSLIPIVIVAIILPKFLGKMAIAPILLFVVGMGFAFWSVYRQHVRNAQAEANTSATDGTEVATDPVTESMITGSTVAESTVAGPSPAAPITDPYPATTESRESAPQEFPAPKRSEPETPGSTLSSSSLFDERD